MDKVGWPAHVTSQHFPFYLWCGWCKEKMASNDQIHHQAGHFKTLIPVFERVALDFSHAPTLPLEWYDDPDHPDPLTLKPRWRHPSSDDGHKGGTFRVTAEFWVGELAVTGMCLFCPDHRAIASRLYSRGPDSSFYFQLTCWRVVGGVVRPPYRPRRS